VTESALPWPEGTAEPLFPARQLAEAWIRETGWELPTMVVEETLFRDFATLVPEDRRAVLELHAELCARREPPEPKPEPEPEPPGTANGSGAPAPPAPPAPDARGQIVVEANAPPQNLDAEESVLGAMMVSPGAIEAVRDRVSVEDFYRASHGLIYRAALALHGRGDAVDWITVADELERTGKLEEAGGKARVAELAVSVPATANAWHYAEIVREMAVLREMIALGGETARLGWERPGALPELLDRLDAGYARVRAKAESRPVAEPFAVYTTRDLCGIPDPPTSDRLLGPLVMRGSRTVIGGSTGEGKTSFALAILAAIVGKREFLGWKGAGGRGLVLDLEQGIRTAKLRVQEVGLADSVAVDYVRVPDGLALGHDPAQAAAVEQLLAAGEYAAVLLDPYYKAHRGDSNEEGPTRDLMRLLDRWREDYGFGLLLPAHTRKPLDPNAKFTIHDIAGSAVLVRGAEIVLGIRLVADGYSRLYFFKDRDGVDDLPVNPLGGKGWGLFFDKTRGYRRDTKDIGSDDGTRKAPAALIAVWVRSRPDATARPGEIMEAFEIADATLKARREPLAKLGIEYVAQGRDSYYRSTHADDLDPAPADPALLRGAQLRGQEPHEQAELTPQSADPAVDEPRDSESGDLQGNPHPADPALSYREEPAPLRGGAAADSDQDAAA
jgi:hypothetical protein